MITGVGIGLVGFGLILAYAGVTGQHVKEELGAVFTGHGAGGPASSTPRSSAPPSGGTNPLPGKPGGAPLLTQPQPGTTGRA